MNRPITQRPMLIAVVLVLVLGAGMWFSGTWRTAQVVRTSVGQPLGAATRAEVDIAMGVGRLQIGALAQPGNLIAGEIAYPEANRVDQSFAVSGDTASFTLREQDSQSNSLVKFKNEDALWDLRLAPGVRLGLNIESGVGESTIDLSKLQVGELTFKSGVGPTTLTLPRQGHVHAQIQSGIGSMIIRVPVGVAVRIEAHAGVGGVEVRGDYWRQGDLYISPEYETAADRVDLTVNGGIGGISIQQVGK
jgi:hypothetical protein